MGKILLRIYQFTDSQGISIRELERTIGATNGVISGAIKNNREIGSDKIENFLQAYPQVSAEWLFRGIGEMLIQPDDSAAKNPTLDFVVKYMASEIDELKAKVKHLEANNEKLLYERQDWIAENHDLHYKLELARKGEIASVATGSSDVNAV